MDPRKAKPSLAAGVALALLTAPALAQSPPVPSPPSPKGQAAEPAKPPRPRRRASPPAPPPSDEDNSDLDSPPEKTIAPAPAAILPPADPARAFSNKCNEHGKKILNKDPTALADIAPEGRREFLEQCFDAADAARTSGAVSAGDELLRAVGQIVAKRAQRAAWEALREKLKEAAKCPDQDEGSRSALFPATCEVLDTLSIKDLLASPKVLLEAVLFDFMVNTADLSALHPEVKALLPATLGLLVKTAPKRWRHSGISGLTAGMATALKLELRKHAAYEACDAAWPSEKKAFWVGAMCTVQTQAAEPLKECRISAWAGRCGGEAEDRAEIVDLVTTLKRSNWGSETMKSGPLVDFFFMTADAAIDSAQGAAKGPKGQARDYVHGLRGIYKGLTGKDWIQTTSGAIQLARAIAKAQAPCAPGGACALSAEAAAAATELFAVLAAVGNQAEVFETVGVKSGPEKAADARQAILEELIDRMVNRTDRTSGVVVSLGGNLGFLGGVRTDLGAYQAAFPVQLGLGVGLQTYHEGAGGFHMMVSAFDLGQYVTFDSGDLDVEPPGIEASVMLGVTAGGWFMLRETPAYIGAFGGVSPFVRSGEELTYQLGLVSGLYVPLLDFN
ncbi:MAG TPA: hypothetical protein VK459_14160 [Polyangiaceae bacterium]|nr:hypothetical protein [Polyangiaceae bacterium]